MLMLGAMCLQYASVFFIRRRHLLLIAPSVSGLQTLVNICETELMNVDVYQCEKNLSASESVHEMCEHYIYKRTSILMGR